MLSLPPPENENIYGYTCVFKYFSWEQIWLVIARKWNLKDLKRMEPTIFAASLSSLYLLYIISFSLIYQRVFSKLANKNSLCNYYESVRGFLQRNPNTHRYYIYSTFWSNSALSTARLSTWRLNSWTCVRGFRDFSGSGIGSLPSLQNTLNILILAFKFPAFLRFYDMCKSKWSVTYSFRTGWALNILILVSSSSILRLSSISLCISSSCLTKLSSWKGSGFVQCLGSGFGGICSNNSYSLLDKLTSCWLFSNNQLLQLKTNLISWCLRRIFLTTYFNTNLKIIDQLTLKNFYSISFKCTYHRIIGGIRIWGSPRNGGSFLFYLLLPKSHEEFSFFLCSSFLMPITRSKRWKILNFNHDLVA